MQTVGVESVAADSCHDLKEESQISVLCENKIKLEECIYPFGAMG